MTDPIDREEVVDRLQKIDNLTDGMGAWRERRYLLQLLHTIGEAVNDEMVYHACATDSRGHAVASDASEVLDALDIWVRSDD